MFGPDCIETKDGGNSRRREIDAAGAPRLPRLLLTPTLASSLARVCLRIGEMSPEASQRVFGIQELLRMIFEELGDPRTAPQDGVGSDLVSCATVSQFWSATALPIIWNRCEGAALGLFAILDDLNFDHEPVVSARCERNSRVFKLKIMISGVLFQRHGDENRTMASILSLHETDQIPQSAFATRRHLL